MDDFVKLPKATLRTDARVWDNALAAIVNKTMDVNAASIFDKVALLHFACYYGKVDVVRQLLFVLHANPSAKTKVLNYRPMHYAAMRGSSNALEICKLLPVADSIYSSQYGVSPLSSILGKLPDDIHFDLFQWMLCQPQFDVIANHARIIQYLHCYTKNSARLIPMVNAEIAARKRWTAARAAWCAAACV